MKERKKKPDEEQLRRMSNALDRQIKGIQVNAKLASDATRGDNYKEVNAWLTNAQNCLTEAAQIACDLRDALS